MRGGRPLVRQRLGIDGLRVQFDGVDAHRERARTTGANVLRGPEDVPVIGVRLYTAEDVEGHRSTFVESVVS